jgi:uncharacterized protein (DUF58 family)
MDFREVRPYVAGDEVKHIDWNVTARTGSPHIKVSQEDKEQLIVLALDVSQSMTFDPAMWSTAKLAVLALSYLAMAQQDRVGLLLYSAQNIDVVPPGKGQMHFAKFEKRLSLVLSSTVQASSSIALLSQTLSQTMWPRSTVYLVSDFFMSLDTKSLDQIRRRHRICWVRLRPSLESRPLPRAGMVRWFDSEKRTLAVIDSSSQASRTKFDESVQRRELEAKSSAQRCRAGYVSLFAGTDPIPSLVSFLQRTQNSPWKKGR